MDTDNKISWDLIEKRLKEMGQDSTWLAGKLGIGKQAVSNWKPRGGAPVAYAKDIAKHLNLSVGELLGSDDPIDTPKRPDNQPLSDEARELISCVARLDALGDIPRQMFVHHKGILLLSVASTELEHLFTGRKRLAKAEQELAHRNENPGGHSHVGRKHK